MKSPTPSSATTWPTCAANSAILLLQVVFHARMAEEAGHFAFDDVAQAISDKMEARHPHIFGDGSHRPAGRTIKAQERAAKGATSAMDGVARALPALLRAEKLQKRAARVGFRLAGYRRSGSQTAPRKSPNCTKPRADRTA